VELLKKASTTCSIHHKTPTELSGVVDPLPFNKRERVGDTELDVGVVNYKQWVWWTTILVNWKQKCSLLWNRYKLS